MEWLRSYRPDLVDRYEELYERGAYLPPAEQARLRGLLGRLGARADGPPPPTRCGRARPVRPAAAGAASAAARVAGSALLTRAVV